jgi:hypothetical protein
MEFHQPPGGHARVAAEGQAFCILLYKPGPAIGSWMRLLNRRQPAATMSDTAKVPGAQQPQRKPAYKQPVNEQFT